MTSRFFLAGIAFFVTSFVCAAADEEKAVDYGTGLKQLSKMGLPDVSDAKYVSFQDYSRSDGLIDFGMYLDGGAWVLEEDREGVSRVFDMTRLMTVECRYTDYAAMAAIQAAPAEAEPEKVRRGMWQEADVDADIEELIEPFAELADADPATLAMMRGQIKFDVLLICAALFYDHGEVEQANRLTALIFKYGGDRRELLRKAVSRIVDGQYNRITDSFNTTGDWQTYHDQLAALVEKRGKLWQRSAAARELLPKLKARAETKPQPLPDTFTEAQRQAAADVLNNVSALQSIETIRGEWLLFPPNNLTMQPADAPLVRFLGLREQALPVLLEWLDNGDLTPVISFDGDNETPDIDMAMFSQIAGELDPSEVQEFMKQMQAQKGENAGPRIPAPQELSALARHLLTQLIAQSMYSMQEETDDAMLREKIAAIQEMDRLALARYYLQEGSGDHVQSAIRYITLHGTEDDLRKIENRILAKGEDGMYEMMSYVVNRGEAGTSFLEKYTDQVEVPEYYKDQLEKLRDYMNPGEEQKKEELSLDEVLARFKTVDDVSEMNQELMKAAGGLQSEVEKLSAIRKILVLAGEVEEDAKKMALLNILRLIPSGYNYSNASRAQFEHYKPVSWETVLKGEAPAQKARFGEEIEKPENEWNTATGLKLLREQKDEWLALLDEQVNNIQLFGGMNSVAVTAARMVLQLGVGMEAMQMYGRKWQSLMKLPDKGSAWTVQAAKDIVNGKTDTLPDPPDPAGVPDERREEILNQLKTASAEENRDMLAALTASEYLVLLEILGKDDTADEITDRLHKAASFITKTGASMEDAETAAALKKLLNTRFSVDAAKQVLELVKQQTRDGKGAVAAVSFTLSGAEIFIQDIESMPMFSGGMADEVPQVSGWLQSEEDYFNATWPLQEEADAQETGEEDLDEVIAASSMYGADPDDFWEGLKNALAEKKIMLSGTLNLAFVGINPKEKGAEDDE